MKVVKPAKIPVLTRIVEIARRPHFHVAGIVAFPLDNPRGVSDELSFWKTTATALGENGIFDEGFAKARGELLVCGSFCAPEGKPIPASYVRARVGSVDKRLAVVGDRIWQGGAPSAPAPMTTMPIDWAHAFGGARFDRNPYGKGAEPTDADGHRVHQLPNIERYGALIRSEGERPEPAGFLPMDVTFAQRRARGGSYDKGWFEEHFPGMPPDMHPTFFNVAPDDQWIDGAFGGDEEFLVENMHSDKPKIEGRLPGLAVRSFVTHRTAQGERFLEIPLRCDLVWLFPTAGIGAVVFHGSMRVADDDAADVAHLVVACEEPARTRAPRPIEHYQAVLARRLDKDKGAIAGISDSDLMPPRESGVVANIDGGDVGRWVRSEKLLSRNVRRGAERDRAEVRERLRAEGRDPDLHGAPELEPEPEVPSVSDLDAVAAFAESLAAHAEDAKRQSEKKDAEARAKAREVYAQMGKDYDEVMAKASKESAGPPKFSARAHLATMEDTAQRGRERGYPVVSVEERLADPKFRTEIEESELQFFELYRRFGHYQPAAVPMDAEGSQRVRTLVELALETGESLAGRDFTGADLSRLRLVGVNLSGALLEAADLSGCDLSGANLEGAMLARTNLSGAKLDRARMKSANLGGANLRDAVFDGAELRQSVLTGAVLTGARFTGAVIAEVQWMEVVVSGADFSGAVLTGSTLIKTDLRNGKFTGADLSRSTIVEARVDGADFSGARMEKVSFVGCAGEGVAFRSADFRQGVMVHGSSFPRADFSDANLEKANFRGSVLAGARFDGANLAGADLSSCDATGASFDRAMMKGAMLIRTNLSKASLQGTDLMDALASKALLPGADFRGANLYRADLSRVVGDADTSFADAEVGHVRSLPKADVPAPGRRVNEP